MSYFIKKVVLATAIVLTSSNTLASIWKLDKSVSEMSFLTVKKDTVPEIQSFDNIDASINGYRAKLVLDTASINTNIDIRDQRIRDWVLKTGLLPNIVLTMDLPEDLIDSFLPGDTLATSLAAQLQVGGAKQTISVDAHITQTEDNKLIVNSKEPVIIDTNKFALTGGVEQLRTVAGLNVITQRIPVFFSLSFDKQAENTPSPVKGLLAIADVEPIAPSQPTTAVNGKTVYVQWAQLADNVDHHIVSVKHGDGAWNVVGKVPADTMSYQYESVKNGETSIRVQSVSMGRISVPSIESKVTVSGSVVEDMPPVTGGGTLLVDKFNAEINQAIIQETCVGCHSEGEIAGGTKLRFAKGASKGIAEANAEVLTNYPNAQKILAKVSSTEVVDHYGASLFTFSENSTEYQRIKEFLAGDSFFNSVQLTGVLHQVWNNTRTMDDLKAHIINNDTPDAVNIQTSADAPRNIGSNFVSRMTTIVKVSQSGSYHFYLASDDDGELYLNEVGQAKQKIAYVKGWTKPEQWTKQASQKSAAFELVAGKSYRLEALHVEIGGNDHVSIAWSRNNGAIEILSGPNLSYQANDNASDMPAPPVVILPVLPTPELPIIEPTPPVVISPPVIITPPVVEPILPAADTDGDGVIDVLDQFPNDATRIADQGFKYERWKTVLKSTAELVNHGAFQEKSLVDEHRVGSFDAPRNVDNAYIMRMRAYITPTQSGDYIFYANVDDGGVVYLSDSTVVADKKKIIDVETWQSKGQFTKYPEQASTLIRLKAGKSYYLEARAYEGGGGDHLAVAWSRIDSGQASRITIIPAENIQNYYIPEGFTAEDFLDGDGDGVENYLDPDKDNDGVNNEMDLFPLNPAESADFDKDGLGDNADNDDDNDGIVDSKDLFPLDSSRASINDADNVSVNRDVLQAKCVVCHSETGPAKNTKLVYRIGNTPGVMDYNETQLAFYITDTASGGQTILDKSRGLQNHGGGAVLQLSSDEYELLEMFVGFFNGSDDNPVLNTGTYILESPEVTYRRASLYLTGEIPSQQKLNSLKNASDELLQEEVLNLMTGDGFHNFIKDSANARIHSRHLKNGGNAGSLDKFYEGDMAKLKNDLAEEPLELIAYIVENDRPYSEILTADYTMAGQESAVSFRSGVGVAEGSFVRAINNGQADKTEAPGYTNPDGTFVEDFPHAGILSSWAYLSQYPTTATNRNRARSAWTMKHFLGFDIENSSARVLDVADVADQNNPTMNNPACVACHQTMDPIAAGFQNFESTGGYKLYGTDSLDVDYRKSHPDVSWYHDNRQLGYRGIDAPDDVNPIQWLAEQMVADFRFSVGAVKFWWPSLFGGNVLNESASRIHFDNQSLLITALSNDFRSHLNLKQLLVNMVMSDAFRVAKKSVGSLSDDLVELHGGARHFLTPHELYNKTLSLTGFGWSRLLDSRQYYGLYGGINGVDVKDETAEPSAMMFRVAERQGMELACAIVKKDFDSEQQDRLLFTEVERESSDAASVKAQIVVLYERLHNKVVDINDSIVVETYALFTQLRVNRMKISGTRLNQNQRCEMSNGGSDYDPEKVLGPWKDMLIMMMADPDYLFE